jgi:putative DNA-invertase from lambdoid prophage Rac
MAVYGYARVSTARQASEGESLEVQQRQIEGYALMHGLTLAGVLVEEGVSGSVPVEERPVGGPLFAKLQRGDIVIAAKLDRLFRSALDALKVVESLKTRGVKLHLLDLGGDIAGNGLSKLFLTIAAAFAEAERDRIRERIGQVKADQKARGRYLGGKLPFGFRRSESGDLVPHEAEQETIREIVALRAQGRPLRVIAEAVAAKGHRLSHEGVAGVLRASGVLPAKMASSSA